MGAIADSVLSLCAFRVSLSGTSAARAVMVTAICRNSGHRGGRMTPMRTRIAIAALITALLALGALPWAPARAAEFTYDFEGCQQGWEAKKGGNWTHGTTTLPSSNASSVMKNFLYPNDESRGDTLTSK